MKKHSFLEEKECLTKPHLALQELGISYFSYGVGTKGRLLTSYFSHKEWGQLYRKNRYDRLDPLFYGIFFSKLPLIFWEALPLSGKEKEIMMERNEVCGIRSGLTIGITSETRTEIIALGSSATPKEFYKLMNEEISFQNIHSIMAAFRSLTAK